MCRNLANFLAISGCWWRWLAQAGWCDYYSTSSCTGAAAAAVIIMEFFWSCFFLTKPFTASSYNLLQFLGAFFLGVLISIYLVL
jgi:hypothetical protein